MTSVLDSTSKVTSYIDECARLKIPVLPPDIAQSGMGFTVSDEGSVLAFWPSRIWDAA